MRRDGKTAPNAGRKLAQLRNANDLALGIARGEAFFGIMSAPSVLNPEGAVKNQRRWMTSAVVVLICSSMLVKGQQSTATPAEYSFTISASQVWTDTGVDLAPGETLNFNAEAKSGAGNNCNPGGAGVAASPGETLPAPALASGVLLAKTSEKGDAEFVGNNRELKTERAGHLFLGINQSAKSDCAFAVKVRVAPVQASAAAQPRNVKDQLSSAAKVWLQGQFGNSQSNKTEASSAISNSAATGASTASVSASAGLKLPAVLLDADLRTHIDGLPRRVHDHAGNPGDMVNFVMVGSQERVQAALEAADWHVADVDSKEAGLKAILNTYEKKDYLEMPMSHLYLFDRMQDFGYEQAQAYAVVASRHHFRIWKAPFTWSDETVWVGAGTHDVGFEKDIRTGHLTHKIDPSVDLERENIAQSLDKSGRTKSMTYYLPPNPVQDAKNASGGGYHSDGKLLVVFLK